MPDVFGIEIRKKKKLVFSATSRSLSLAVPVRLGISAIAELLVAVDTEIVRVLFVSPDVCVPSEEPIGAHITLVRTQFLVNLIDMRF